MIRPASFGRRLWALVLDTLLDLLVLGALRALIGDGELVASFGCWYLIHHVGLVTEGGPLGHRLAGLRIVRAEDGERVGVAHAFAREFARLALSLPPLGMGFLWMLDQAEGRTWHDLIAGTTVVREVPERVHAEPSWAAAPPWREPPAAVEALEVEAAR
ncbi:MAG: hypothetical protein JWM98_744 [Thermoleophilia bacterium]|nr:hypothetical protein [Thermoleophilia bacterium]